MEQEETAADIGLDVPISVEFKRRKKLKTKRRERADFDGGAEGFFENSNECEFSTGITVSEFDYSVENHFRAVYKISRLCGESDPQDFDPAEIRRLSSLITFLEEWRQFSYPSKNLRFTFQNQNKTGKDFVGAVTLPQFSSACVPKEDVKNAGASLAGSR